MISRCCTTIALKPKGRKALDQHADTP
jgi:hypothetical protein